MHLTELPYFSAHPINPVDLVLTKTNKILCASVKGQRHLPADGLWEATPLTAITRQMANPPLSDNDADTKKNLKNTALPVNPFPQYEGFSPSFYCHKSTRQPVFERGTSEVLLTVMQAWGTKAWWLAAIGLTKLASEQADGGETPKGAALASQ